MSDVPISKRAATSDRREALRESLIEAARRRIAENGFQALRARDVAADVGCALGAIYLVFPDLDALIAAVRDRTLDELERQAGAIAQRSPNVAEAKSGDAEAATGNLKALAALYLQFARNHRNLWRALFEHRAGGEGPQNSPAKVIAIFSHVDRQLVVLAPGLGRRSRAILAHAILAAVHGVVAFGLDHVFDTRTDQEIAWQVETVVELIAKGLATDRAALAGAA